MLSRMSFQAMLRSIESHPSTSCKTRLMMGIRTMAGMSRKAAEANIQLHPLPQSSTWADPEFHGQDKMPQAFGGTNHSVQFFEV